MIPNTLRKIFFIFKTFLLLLLTGQIKFDNPEYIVSMKGLIPLLGGKYKLLQKYC